jgi:hypothetical protein
VTTRTTERDGGTVYDAALHTNRAAYVGNGAHDALALAATASDFEIAPGMHVAQVRMAARRPRGEIISHGFLRVCFVAQAGHTYAMVPCAFATGVRHGLWYPQVADETSNT